MVSANTYYFEKNIIPTFYFAANRYARRRLMRGFYSDLSRAKSRIFRRSSYSVGLLRLAE
jgi:hypothetical protein